MKLPAFEYLRPLSVADATAALQDEETQVLAGGQSLLPLMAFRLARPERLVDVSRLDELRGVHYDQAAGLLSVGAAVTHREIMNNQTIRQVAPYLRTIGSHIGHEAIRARGTLGGSLSHADPAAEWPALAVAVGATMELRSHETSRAVSATKFCDGAYTTTIQPGEMLTSVVLDVGRIRSVGFAEVSRRPGDFALAGAVWVTTRDTGNSRSAQSVTVFGLTSQPVRIPLTAGPGDIITGRDDLIEQAQARVTDMSNVRGDIHASERLRMHLASEMVARACASAGEHTGAGNAD